MGPWASGLRPAKLEPPRTHTAACPLPCVRPSSCCLLPGGKPVLGLGTHSGGWRSALGHLPIFPGGPNSQTGPTSP